MSRRSSPNRSLFSFLEDCAQRLMSRRGRRRRTSAVALTPAGARLRLPSAAAAALAVVTLACAEPLEFADWTVPAPEGTEVIGYTPVDAADREGQRVEVVEDLTIGARGEDQRYLFYRPYDIDVAPDGSIYLLDRGNFNVKVFDADGEHVRTFANEGEGPGELSRPIAAAIVGDRYVVNDGATLSVWSLGGEYRDDLASPVRSVSSVFYPIREDSVIFNFTRRGSDMLRTVYARVYLDDRAPLEVAEMPLTLRTLRRGTTGLIGNRRVMTASADGRLYLTNGDEYQVMSWDLTGAPRWALRVAQPRQPYSEAEIENVLAQQRERYPDILRSELEMWEYAPTLRNLLVDGHGHLYVFLHTWVAPFSELHDYPIDVYSPAGERLFAGSTTLEIPGGLWEEPVQVAAAHGDHVYQLELDPAGDWQIVRYRLEEPFE
jgi:hypothetical protein